MNLVHLVAVLALMQFYAFGMLVGRARIRYGIKAPATSGHEAFERAFRVQMNTLEQLVVFLPALLLSRAYWSSGLVAAIGCVYLVGRGLYAWSYSRDPATRAPGFLLTVFPTAILLVLALIGALRG